MALQSSTHAPYAGDTTLTRFGASPTCLRTPTSTTTPSGSHTPSPHSLGPISGPKNASITCSFLVNGKETRAVEFTRVLHVPDLRSNLLSCLYLARHKGFNITISAQSIDFQCKGISLFTATIHSNNSAELDGSTVTSETAFCLYPPG
ncbi:hypothetical protein AGABI2DRAFT_117952 [Agaricus bisporus var. bisporus H97]|uniref:hypothetical protein n=1 Tax=Agaricus bisporus var. bisporus (strain H97 / ATCC MYA-4626 / FGSC 10389) TaxID=936046 RepID=UPI00029F506D|nr:hypothetical protein AGABI2DRAFT_117952 [Agaricus bisporus var. bisporus H97]EKV47365.1 hypothetical protein AGABI2DRAFT_117952 [Agaricus bisporus var. bisporus H97]